MNTPFVKIFLYAAFVMVCIIALKQEATITLLRNTTEQIQPQVQPIMEQETAAALRLQEKGNWAAAADLLRKNAYANNPKAKLAYAFQLAKGWGVKRNLNAARDLLLQATNYDFSGRADAAYELGKLYKFSRGPDCQTIAFKWFSKSLKWGKQKAHLELAKAHARALGVPKDITLARYHYRQAALNGSPSAAISLVQLIYKTNQDNKGVVEARSALREFLPLIEAAANKGKSQAARSLARLYEKDSIVSADIAKAIYWYEKASKTGDRAAMHGLAMLALNQNELPFSEEKIVELLETSADLGYSGAMTALGRLHLEQRFQLPQKGAITWFQKGIASGHPGSMEEMARLHLKGSIVPKNKAAALDLAKQGAKLKHKGSISLLLEIQSDFPDLSSNFSTLPADKKG